MEREITEVYCGNGKGKTTLALGQGLRFAAQGKSVIIIQFLKGKERREVDFLEELYDDHTFSLCSKAQPLAYSQCCLSFPVPAINLCYFSFHDSSSYC